MNDARRRLYFSLVRELRALGARPEATAIELHATRGDADTWREGEGQIVWAYAEGTLDATLRHAEYLPATVRAAGLRGLETLTALEQAPPPRPALRVIQGGKATPPRAA